MRPIAACAMVVNKRTRVSQVTPESPGIPHAMVYGLFRVLPGARALWSPSPVELLPRTWRQRRGVRTTRLCRPLSRRSSPALPASTASRPAFRDVAQRPSVGRDKREYRADLASVKQKYFLQRGWTSANAPEYARGDLPVGQNHFEDFRSRLNQH